MVDALAQKGDEGRGELRKASGSCKQALIRGYPNGETLLEWTLEILTRMRTQGSEPSQYLKEKKSTEISQVVASEREIA